MMLLAIYTIIADIVHMQLFSYDSGDSSFALSSSVGPISSLHLVIASSLARHNASTGPDDM